MITRDDGTSDFHALRSQRRGHKAVLFAFDLIEHDGNDLRDLPLIDRKWRLGKLIGKAKKWRAIQFVEHLTGDGPTVFEHVCRMGLEGIVSKRVDAPYRSGPSRTWLKSKNPESAAVRREREEEWRSNFISFLDQGPTIGCQLDREYFAASTARSTSPAVRR